MRLMEWGWNIATNSFYSISACAPFTLPVLSSRQQPSLLLCGAISESSSWCSFSPASLKTALGLLSVFLLAKYTFRGREKTLSGAGQVAGLYPETILDCLYH